MGESSEIFYERLSQRLEESNTLPGYFTYKFIFKNHSETLVMVQKQFDGIDYQIDTKNSKNEKYLSVTLVIFATNAQMVVHYYQKVGAISGIIML